MNRNDKGMLALAKEHGFKVTEKPKQKSKDDEKRLHKNEQKRICYGLPVGRIIVVKDNNIIRT